MGGHKGRPYVKPIPFNFDEARYQSAYGGWPATPYDTADVRSRSEYGPLRDIGRRDQGAHATLADGYVYRYFIAAHIAA
jgi:hypothetical protein